MKKNILKDRNIVDFEFQIAKNETTHLHKSIELLYIIEGDVQVVVEENIYNAKPEDIIVINTSKKHSYQADSDVLIAYFEIDFNQLCEILNTNQLLFWCNSVVDKNGAYDDIRRVIKQIFNQYYNKSEQGALVLIGQYYQMLRLLTENFRVDSGYAQFLSNRSNDENRQEKIAEYIALNYNKRISLQEMAKNLYMSVPYLSKYIKKQFGMNFSDYISDIRLLHAMDDLMYTDHTIMNVAIDNGFASANAFNELFRKRYNSTPSEYRKKIYKKSETDKDISDEGIEERKLRIDNYLDGIEVEDFSSGRETNAINVINVGEGISLQRNWNRMINAGRISELLRYDMQEQLTTLKKELDFKMVRVWDLFAPELMINENNKSGVYNFEKLDKALDFMVDNDIIPYIEMGLKPKTLHKTLSNQIFSEMREGQFETFDERKKFFEGFSRHLVNRYGIEELEKWHFEQWNGEDFENDGENKDFFEVFEALYKSIKTVSPATKVGGGGIGIQYGNGNLIKLIDEWGEQTCRPDFISLYCYPYIKGDEDGVDFARIASDKDFLKNRLDMARHVIDESKLRGCEIHVSEWSFTISNRNVLNDSCYKGAYIIKNVLNNMDEAQVLGYWISTDIFAEFYDNSSILFGGCGLLSKKGIKKPAYYAYLFLSYMKNKAIFKDENTLITTDGHDNYYIVCHNYQHLNYKYFLKSEDEQDISCLSKLNEDNSIQKFDYQLDNVKNGKYKIKTYSISENYGSVQREWLDMGMPDNLSKQEVEYLNRVCIPHIQMSEKNAQEESLIFSTKLSPQEIQYIHVKYLYE
ncbi:MAG: GH39 family glycosyl hydrolase [Suipraeoptans sp.]